MGTKIGVLNELSNILMKKENTKNAPPFVFHKLINYICNVLISL